MDSFYWKNWETKVIQCSIVIKLFIVQNKVFEILLIELKIGITFELKFINSNKSFAQPLMFINVCLITQQKSANSKKSFKHHYSSSSNQKPL